jgi:hypothetical protein
VRRIWKRWNIAGRKAVLYFAIYDKNDTYAYLTSGIPHEEPQFLYLDYDEFYEPEEWERIVKENSLRRALAIESSPLRFWLVSFSPLPIGKICEIMFNSTADKKHCAHLFTEGFVSLRLSKKSKFGNEYPRLKHTYNNPEGTNFYDFDREKAFLKAIKEGVNVEEKDKKQLFDTLTKTTPASAENLTLPRSGGKKEVDDDELW